MIGPGSISLLRPHDLLSLDFDLINLRISDDATMLQPQDDSADSLLIVHFPPQAIAEADFMEGSVGPPPIRTMMAGPTRLVFRIPAGVTVPLSAEGLVDWKEWEPVLAPTALPRGTTPDPSIPPTGMPGATETAIEFPWRLVLSPDELGRWETNNDAAVSPPYQLWSAVLRDRSGDDVFPVPPAEADVRALGRFEGPGFSGSIGDDFLRQIVHLSSDFHLSIPPADGRDRFTPVPIRARRLELTSLGANADLHAKWEYPLVAPDNAPDGYVPLDLVQYQHIAALGRDHFVRTVRVGYLCSTGHRAVVVRTVERLPSGMEVVGQASEGGALFGGKGYLIRTAEVQIQQPVVDYGPLAGAFSKGGREFPFKRIRIVTQAAKIHPNLTNPDPDEDEAPDPFWLIDPGGHKVMFEAIGTDMTDNEIHFSLPLMFVPFTGIGEHEDIRWAYEQGLAEKAHEVALSGQSVALAPADPKPGSTSLSVSTIRLEIEQPPHHDTRDPDFLMNASGAPRSFVPRFLPRLASFDASVPAVDTLVGNAETRELTPDPVYLAAGFDQGQNPAQAFVRFVNDLSVGLPTQRGGGLASPTWAAKSISRTLGPTSEPERFQGGVAQLSAFADTKLLGTIPILDLLPINLPFDAAAADSEVTQADLDNPNVTINPPRLITRRLPDGVETRFVWKPPLKRRHDVSSVFALEVAGDELVLDARTTVALSGEASSSVVGWMRNVKLTFIGALSADIEELIFRSENGRKMEVGATNVRITFLGPLAFVNSLQRILPTNGFDDPPAVTVDAQGVVAGYSLGVPNVGIGIFSIQNIGLSSALSIPFTDRPAGVRFAISERHKPFLVTVSLFGGGGFFAVGVSAKGLESVEASLEFGGNISLNLGIASGGVYVMAGIYFGMKATSVELTGYLRCGGYLDILGLISISLEFYLAFTYRKKEGKGSEVWGQASLTVSVEVAFFSKSVTLSVERRFAGSDGDPSFAQTVSLPQWVGYLQAFA